jgi:hypothetical protein
LILRKRCVPPVLEKLNSVLERNVVALAAIELIVVGEMLKARCFVKDVE